MFGRSGQMFPRQRAYHDAIYQEEYAGEGGEDCCRSRGLSAVFCWFLSVIILIGLAASVILTVFFILKSRSFVGASSNGEDLDIMYNFGGINDHEAGGSEEHPVSIPPTTATTTTLSPRRTFSPSSSTTTTTSTLRSAEIRPHPPTDFSFTSPPYKGINSNKGSGSVENSSTRRTYFSPPVRGSNPTTMIIPTAQTLDPAFFNTRPSTVNDLFDKLRKFNEDFPKSPSRESLGKHSGEVTSDEGLRYAVPGPTHTTFTDSGSPHLLFTMPPNKIGSHFIRRTTRPPRVKSFLPAYTNSNEFRDLTSSERTLLEIKSHVSPTIEVHLAGGHTVSVETDSTPRPSASASEEERQNQDVLYRIIKNLAPKFKNKTNTSTNHFNPTTRKHVTTPITTTSTTTTTETANQPVTWDHVEGEPPEGQNLFQEDTSDGYGFKGGSAQPFEVVQAPNFTAVYENTSEDYLSSTPDANFMDVLVGNENQKTLFTKETENGIITSAILPPWYENVTYNGSLSDALQDANLTLYPNDSDNNSSAASAATLNGTTIENLQNFTEIPPSTIPGRITADIGNLFLNWFSNSPLPYNSTSSSEANATGTGSKVKGEPTKKKTSWRDLLKGLTPMFPKSPPRVIPEPAKNAFHFGTTDGTSDIYGYYSEDPLVAMSHPLPYPHHVHPHHPGFGHTHGQGQDMIDRSSSEENSGAEGEDVSEASPSHVIDIAYDPKERPEIIIEPEQEQDGRKDYGDYMEPSASDTQSHAVVVPPPNGIGVQPTGGGIRRPMEIIEKLPASQSQNALNATLAPSTTNNKTKSSNNSSGEILDDSSKTSTTSRSIPALVSEEDYNDFIRIPDYPVGEENGLTKRKPITGLDIRGLYPAQLSASPRDPISDPNEDAGGKSIFEVYPIPYETESSSASPLYYDLNSAESSATNQTTDKLDFIPPKPLSFHTNSYSFSPSVSTGGFLPSGDDWRPVLYDKPARHQNINAIMNPRTENADSSYEPATHRDEFPIVNPIFPKPTKATPSLVVLSTPNHSGEKNGEDRNIHVFLSSTPDPVTSQSSGMLPIRPSQQIPPMVKFPNAPQIQHQHAAAGIDRSKYVYRPASPPIVMRRTPQQNLPYLPSRNQNQITRHGPGPGPGSSHPQFPRIPPNYITQQHQLKQQQRLKQHLYEQNMMRLQQQGQGQGRPPPGPGYDNRIPPQFSHSQNRRTG